MSKIRLESEIEIWKKEEFISEEQAEKILDYYKGNIKVKKNFKENMSSLLYILAGVCMALGIIAIISYNWSYFGMIERVIIGLMPVVLSAGLCIYAYIKKSDTGFVNFVVLTNCGAVIASIALIGQIFHLNGSLYSLLIVTAGLIFFMFFVFESLSTIIIFTLLTTVGVIYSLEIKEFSFILFIYTVAILLLGIYQGKFLDRNFIVRQKVSNFVNLAVCFSLYLLFVPKFLENVDEFIFLMAVAVILLRFYEYAMIILYEKLEIPIDLVILKKFNKILIIITILFGLFEVEVQEFHIIYLFVIGGLFLSKGTLKERMQDDFNIFYCLFCLFVILSGLIAFYADVVIITSLVLYATKAVKRNDYRLGVKVFNTAIFYIVVKFFMSSADLMVKAILLIVISIILLVVNKIFRGKKYEK